MASLTGAHPLIVEKVPLILEEMEKRGNPMMIIEGLRETARQQKLYAQSRTAPGKRVTNADGIIKKSKHQIQSDGYFHAVDIVFLTARGRATWEGPWDAFGKIVRKHGLKWGGDFKTLRNGKLVPFPDCPHVEVP